MDDEEDTQISFEEEKKGSYQKGVGKTQETESNKNYDHKKTSVVNNDEIVKGVQGNDTFKRKLKKEVQNEATEAKQRKKRKEAEKETSQKKKCKHCGHTRCQSTKPCHRHRKPRSYATEGTTMLEEQCFSKQVDNSSTDDEKEERRKKCESEDQEDEDEQKEFDFFLPFQTNDTKQVKGCK
eukprot:TRINITY_DN1894_c0_g1_i2.p2 TRINITY_DN1894_c0_g1~~TRINITY_DN1894_c0_g1_i2.p2  ORF type:complete len:181 (+),score=63.18 TRINITY_DN1894_c0_g1_i2:1644-2186(+)